MMFVTDFADPAVVLPLALVASVMLAFTGWPRGVLVWLLAIGVSLGMMAVLKMALFACGRVRIGDPVQSPSGHAASAAIVYSGLVGPIVRRHGADVMLSFLPAPVAATIIGFSRLVLDVHTLTEVLIGGGVGCALDILARQRAGVSKPVTTSGPPGRDARWSRTARVSRSRPLAYPIPGPARRRARQSRGRARGGRTMSGPR